MYAYVGHAGPQYINEEDTGAAIVPRLRMYIVCTCDCMLPTEGSDLYSTFPEKVYRSTVLWLWIKKKYLQQHVCNPFRKSPVPVTVFLLPHRIRKKPTCLPYHCRTDATSYVPTSMPNWSHLKGNTWQQKHQSEKKKCEGLLGMY